MTIRIKMTGVNRVTKALWRIQYRYSRGFKKGLKKAADHVMRQSKKIVPVDTGALKKSGYVEVKGDGFRATATVGYTEHYAIYQHENLMYKHKRGKRAKFLSGPLEKEKDAVVKIILGEMAKARA